MTGIDDLIGKEFGGSSISNSDSDTTQGELTEEEQEFINKNQKGHNYNNSSDKETVSSEIDPFTQHDRAAFISRDTDYAELVITTIKKTVKQEDSLVRQIFYVGLSKDSANPINLAVLAPTSEVKTHPVLESVQYFPKQDVWKVGSMSPRVIIRQNGILVDTNNEPLEGRIKELKKQISDCKDDNEKKEGLEEQLHQLYQEAKVLIDLSSKLLVFLEPPHHETWAILKPILSHDSYEIEHPYVYEVEGMGFKVKKVVTRGWPGCIFCSAKNESKWPEWPEIQSRFLVTSPNMIPQKYQEGNMLIAQRMGLPNLLQQSLIVSDRDVELAKKSVLYLIRQIKQPGTGSVWMPFARTLAKILPAEKGTDNRFTRRLFSFLAIITLSRAHIRDRLEYGSENLAIANLENDLSEALQITYNLSGIPPFKLKLFREFLLPLYKTKQTPDKNKDGDKEEKIIALTTREICEYYREKTGKIISTNNLKQTYLNEFLDNGLIEEEASVINAKQNIYYPLIDMQSSSSSIQNTFGDGVGSNSKEQHYIKTDGITSLSIIGLLDNDFEHFKLFLSKNFIKIPENWLELEISDLLSCPLIPTTFALYNKENKHICIQTFIESYQKVLRINGQGFSPVFCNSYKEIFGKVQYIRRFSKEESKSLSIEPIMGNNVMPDTTNNGTSSATIN